MVNHGSTVSGTEAILQYLKVHYRPGLRNFWHACPKWQAERFPGHSTFTALQLYLFLLPDLSLCIVNNMRIYIYIEESAQNRTPILFLILKIYKIVKNYVLKAFNIYFIMLCTIYISLLENIIKN
jgi:hypothetical protein